MNFDRHNGFGIADGRNSYYNNEQYQNNQQYQYQNKNMYGMDQYSNRNSYMRQPRYGSNTFGLRGTHDRTQEDWSRRRFDKSAADPMIGGSQRLFGGLSLIASRVDLRKLNLLLFLLGCGGVSLFLLWRKYASKWLRSFLVRDTNLDALVDESCSVHAMKQDDPMVVEFNNFVKSKRARRVPKQSSTNIQPIIKMETSLIQPSQLDSLVEEVQAQFESTTPPNVMYTLSQLESISQQELYQLYNANNNSNNSTPTSAKKNKKVHFEDEYTTRYQIVDKCARIMDALRIHMQRDEQ